MTAEQEWTRTDHAARAEELLTEEGRYQFAKIDALTEALTHAILALVEQQRIANLVNLSNPGNISPLFDAGSEGLTAPNGLIRPEIAAALGIEDAS